MFREVQEAGARGLAVDKREKLIGARHAGVEIGQANAEIRVEIAVACYPGSSAVRIRLRQR